jgi:hypothetical protein
MVGRGAKGYRKELGGGDVAGHGVVIVIVVDVTDSYRGLEEESLA